MELARVESLDQDHKSALDALKLGLSSAEGCKDLPTIVLFYLFFIYTLSLPIYLSFKTSDFFLNFF